MCHRIPEQPSSSSSLSPSSSSPSFPLVYLDGDLNHCLSSPTWILSKTFFHPSEILVYFTWTGAESLKLCFGWNSAAMTVLSSSPTTHFFWFPPFTFHFLHVAKQSPVPEGQRCLSRWLSEGDCVPPVSFEQSCQWILQLHLNFGVRSKDKGGGALRHQTIRPGERLGSSVEDPMSFPPKEHPKGQSQDHFHPVRWLSFSTCPGAYHFLLAMVTASVGFSRWLNRSQTLLETCSKYDRNPSTAACKKKKKIHQLMKV